MRIASFTAVCALAALLAAGAAAAEPVAPARQAQLVHLVHQDCGSCHGMTLQGGLGPALTRAALGRKPAAYLERVILEGRPGTAMPGWRPLLDEQDAAWIARYLLQGAPDAR